MNNIKSNKKHSSQIDMVISSKDKDLKLMVDNLEYSTLTESDIKALLKEKSEVFSMTQKFNKELIINTLEKAPELTSDYIYNVVCGNRYSVSEKKAIEKVKDMDDDNIALIRNIFSKTKDKFFTRNNKFLFQHLLPEDQIAYSKDIISTIKKNYEPGEYFPYSHHIKEAYNFTTFPNEFFTLENTKKIFETFDFSNDSEPLPIGKNGFMDCINEKNIAQIMEKAYNKLYLYKSLPEELQNKKETAYWLMYNNKFRYFDLSEELKSNISVIINALVDDYNEVQTVPIKEISEKYLLTATEDYHISYVIKNKPELLNNKATKDWQNKPSIIIKNSNLLKKFIFMDKEILAKILEDKSNVFEMFKNAKHPYEIYEQLSLEQKKDNNILLEFLKIACEKSEYSDIFKLDKKLFKEPDFFIKAFKVYPYIIKNMPEKFIEENCIDHEFKVNFLKEIDKLIKNNSFSKDEYIGYIPSSIKVELMHSGKKPGKFHTFYLEQSQGTDTGTTPKKRKNKM